MSSSSSSYSVSHTSTTSNNGEVTGYSSSISTTTTPAGTTVTSSTQNHGEPAVVEARHYDSQGHAIESTGSGGRVIEDVSAEKQAKRDAEYEERMEDEYAKREGGA